MYVPLILPLKTFFLDKCFRDFEITGAKQNDSGGISIAHQDSIQEQAQAELYGKAAGRRLFPLNPLESSAIPDLMKQSVYKSMMAKVQFAITWVRFDTAFASVNWRVSVHRQVWLVSCEVPQFQIELCQTLMVTDIGLDGFCFSDGGNKDLDDRQRETSSGIRVRQSLPGMQLIPGLSSVSVGLGPDGPSPPQPAEWARPAGPGLDHSGSVFQVPSRAQPNEAAGRTRIEISARDGARPIATVSY